MGQTPHRALDVWVTAGTYEKLDDPIPVRWQVFGPSLEDVYLRLTTDHGETP
jgi:hypothetical protein